MRGAIRLMALAALLLWPATVFAQPGERPPNIVIVLADDVGFTDFGVYGSEIATPNIDALARRGARFTNFHVSPICAPSRAMLLTGVHSHRAGVGNLPESVPPEHRGKPGYLGRLADGVVTIAARLKAVGYDTFMTGKWHLGARPQDLPSAHGFDRSFALDASGGDNWEQRPYLPIYTGREWYEDGKPATLPKDFYSSQFLVDRMIAYLDARPDPSKPFLAYLPFQAVHIPVQAPREFTARYEGVYADGWEAHRQRRFEGARAAGVIPQGARLGPPPAGLRRWEELSPAERALAAKSLAVNAGMLEAMDHHLGRFIDHLKATGAYDNTVFIVLSDNGPEPNDPVANPGFRRWLRTVGYSQDLDRLGERGTFADIGPEAANANAAPGALFKLYASEGGIRVPLIVAGPGVRPEQSVAAFAYVTDIAPTILQLAGASPAPAPAPQLVGKSLIPVLSGAAERVYGPDESVPMEAAGAAALFRGAYKLVKNPPPFGDSQWRLYDIEADPGETQDLSQAMPELAASMRADYERYAKDAGVLEIPPGHSFDRQIARNFQIALLKANAPRLGVIALVVLGLAAALLLAGRRWPGPVSRGTAAVAGALALLVALRFWLRPEMAAEALSVAPVGVEGLGTLRADLGGFFGAAGLFLLIAAWRRDRRWLVPPLVLLALALAGRTLSFALEGPTLAQVPPMIVEALLIVILLFARRGFPNPDKGPA
ncbi:MAG: arylsulfatase [Phenylobacterium sp.]|uniref:arylsulfatase n=1 Tax=Phenylobacterium sp. TaxID=1871053 RepID=UPI00391A7890